MLPDFKNQIIIVQTRMKQIRLNVDEINNLREESNKFVAPTKEKGRNAFLNNKTSKCFFRAKQKANKNIEG